MDLKTLSFNVTEAQYAEVLKYANDNGITPEQAITALTTNALRAGKLMTGIVTEISPAVQDSIKTLHIQALKQYEEEKAAIPAVVPGTPEPEVKDNVITFETSAEAKELVAEINKARALKGLAPVEKSICELLYHWGENLADYNSFADTTGLDFSWYKSKLAELALLEREANGAKSNVIIATGIFSRHSIVDTPAVSVA